jgi:3-phenylpropionate/trans-cinnamate dioxygenase ferredoxin reductase subunit
MAGIIIIGAGECGVRAAFALRELGYKNTVTLIGGEESLPYERPPLSKSGTDETKPIRAGDSYAEANINLRLGKRVSVVDPLEKHIHLEDGECLRYDRLLLATGSRARLFDSMEGCLTLRSDKDAQTILGAFRQGARIGIIGGGFIGLELAATARQTGADVTVVEAAPRLLGRAVPEIPARVLQDRHRAEGVNLILGTGVLEATGTSITLTDNQHLTFDVVIAGVGALPNTDLAAAARLDIANGVVVDENFQTSDTNIFAAGDCCNFEWNGARVRLESWKASQDQGAHAAAAMLGTLEPYAKVPWFWSDQYDMTLQVAGLFDQDQPVIQRNTGNDTCVVFQCDAAGRLLAGAGVGLGNSVAKDIRVLEKLIERRAIVDQHQLADPSTQLKRLLRAA